MMTVRRKMGIVVLAVFGFAAVASGQPVADAAKAADWATVRALVEQGADVTTPQGDGTTALHWAGYWAKTAWRRRCCATAPTPTRRPTSG